ncbi:MAG: TIGR04086 family membrane protein [Clostridia bacterium]|nr:TIGR04086 family membrane protein [Clostridia bacterium]
MPKSKKQKRNKPDSNSIFKCFLIGLISGLVSFVVFLAVFSIVILNTDIPTTYFFIMVLIASGISSIVCAAGASISSSKNKLIIGMLCSITVIIIQFVILLCFNNADLSSKIYLMFPADIVAGFIGCVIGANIRR